jgi:GH24 family phage-related lysozyme (muramidase)
MQTRRNFTLMGISLSANAFFGSKPVFAQSNDAFDALFQDALQNLAILDATRSVREGMGKKYASRAITPRNKPSNRAISEAATQLIILFEVTSGTRYEKEFKHPIWPAGESGVTIGVGYDLGYITPEWLEEDWREILEKTDIGLLSKACGLRGDAAHRALSKFTTVTLPWDKAESQFRKNVLPRYVAETIAVLPNAEKLTNDCLGAMVSLVYNRGASFRKDGERYREMRAIRQHMLDEKYDLIPIEIRKMIRLWKDKPNLGGLVKRRKLEAALFEKGLKI